MSRKSTAIPQANGALHPAEKAAPLLPIPDIQPGQVFTIAQLNAVLGLRPNCLPREFRKRRLRYAKRAGRVWVLGSWVLEWLESGEVRRGQRD
jgi:hypothetical protein